MGKIFESRKKAKIIEEKFKRKMTATFNRDKLTVINE